MSTAAHLEPLLEYAERRAVVTVLRRHPEWTLGHVFSQLEQNDARAPLLRDLTLGELLEDPDLDQVGGPRWKLQDSLRRLVNRGMVERTGSTSGSRYRGARERR